MNNMQSQYGKKGLKVIAINLDESREKAEKFLKQIPADFTIAFDPEANTAKSYKIKAMPSSFIIDQNGHMVYSNQGFHGKDPAKLEQKIRNTIQHSVVASR
jgi:peroxiredoxin